MILMQDTVWVSKDGRRTLIRNMKYSHLLNCINKIQRSQRNWRREYLSRLLLELQMREENTSETDLY